MKNFNIKFEGFYNSIHSVEIDYQLESYYTDEDGDEDGDEIEPPDNIDYQLLYSEYAKLYTQAFNQVVNSELGIKIKIVYKSLWSPREYNFVTDSIDAKLSDPDFNILMIRMMSTPEFIKYVNEASKSRNGFSSCYTGIEEVSADDEILSQYIGMYLIEMYGDEINECLRDDFYSYELVYSLDFLTKECG